MSNYDSIKEDVMCPISAMPLFDPVIAEDGISYNRSLINKYLKNNDTSPLTRKKISNKTIDNINMRNVVWNMIEKSDIFDDIINNMNCEELIELNMIDKIYNMPKFENLIKEQLNFQIIMKMKNWKQLLKKTINNNNINDQNKDGETILISLCKLKSPTQETIVELLDTYNNIDINIKDYFDQSLLYCAIQKRYVKLISKLLDVNTLCIDGEYPRSNKFRSKNNANNEVSLFCALLHLDSSLALIHIESSLALKLLTNFKTINVNDIVHENDNYLITSLKYGTNSVDFQEIIDYIITNYDVNYDYRTSNNDSTALYYAITLHHISIDIFDKILKKSTHLINCCTSNPNFNVLSYLVTNKCVAKTISILTYCPNVNLCLTNNHYVETNTQFVDQNNNLIPSFYVSFCGHSDIICSFVKQFNDINKTNKNGQTLIEFMCKKGQLSSILDMINQNIIDINYQDSNGNTLLHMMLRDVTFYLSDSFIELFHKAIHTDNINNLSYTGRTALIYVLSQSICDSDRHKMVSSLLKNPKINVNVTSPECDNVTPFGIAYVYRHYDICKMIIEHKSFDVSTEYHGWMFGNNYKHAQISDITDLLDIKMKDYWKNKYDELVNNHKNKWTEKYVPLIYFFS